MTLKVFGPVAFLLLLAVSIATQAMLTPFERATMPALRTAPAAVVLIPAFVGAGVHVALLMAIAGAIAGSAKILAPESVLHDFRTAASVAAAAHTPLLVFAVISFVLVFQALQSVDGRPVTPGVLATAASWQHNSAVITATRPWAWWLSAAALIGLTMLVDGDRRRGIQIGGIVVLMFVILNAGSNFLLAW